MASTWRVWVYPQAALTVSGGGACADFVQAAAPGTDTITLTWFNPRGVTQDCLAVDVAWLAIKP